MSENKWVQAIKSIYQDTSTEHDLQIKRVMEEVRNEGYREAAEELSDLPTTNTTEEREEERA